MTEWIASRKNIAVGVLKKASSPSDRQVVSGQGTNDGDTGAAAALKRLEAMELQSFERLEAAIVEGDPIKIRLCHDVWLRCGEALRKYDLQVERDRRNAGEMVPITVVGDFVYHFITDCATVVTLRADGITNEICGKSELEVYGRIRNLFDESIISAIIEFLPGGKHSPDPRLIKYAADALSAKFAQYKGSGLYRDAQKLIDQAKEQS